MIGFLTQLSFQARPALVIPGVVLLLILALITLYRIRSWSRSYGNGVISQEGAKLLASALVVFLLFEPATVKTSTLTTPPQLVILKDSSRSMETKDAGENDQMLSRRDAAEFFLKSDEWQTFRDESEFEIIESEFSKEDQNGTNLSQPLDDILTSHEHLRAVLLLSDGDWNTGKTPTEIAQLYREAKIPIFTLTTGLPEALPDIAIERFTAPGSARYGERIELSSRISTTLPTDTIVELSLQKGETTIDTKTLTIPAYGSIRTSFFTRIEERENTNFTLLASSNVNELNEGNNEKTLSIAMAQEMINVLLIESTPRWEYRFIRNALMRDRGVNVQCLLLHPELGAGIGSNYLPSFPSAEQLQEYDVVFLGDIGLSENELTTEDVNQLAALVKRYASGLVILPGKNERQMSLKTSSISELFPVRIDRDTSGISQSTPSSVELSERGRGSLLTLLGVTEQENKNIWRSLPGFQWYQAGVKAKSGSQVLAYHPNARTDTGRLPLIVTQSYGRGKTLYMGFDSAWKWRRGYEDLYHYRYWSQITRWMAYQRNRAGNERIRLFFSRERPTVGDEVIIRANGFDEQGAPSPQKEIQLKLQSPNGAVQLETLDQSSDWGDYLGNVDFDEDGTWVVQASFTEDPKSIVETSLNILPKPIESLGTPAEPNVMRSISTLSRAVSSSITTPSNVIQELRAIPPRTTITTLSPLAHAWWVYAIIIALLTYYWVRSRNI